MISQHLHILWLLVCPQLIDLWVDGLGSAGPGVAEVVVVRSACGREQRRGLGLLHGLLIGKFPHKHLEFWNWEQPVQYWLLTSFPRESSQDFACLGPPELGKVGDRVSHSFCYHINCRPGLGSWFVAPFKLLHQRWASCLGGRRSHTACIWIPASWLRYELQQIT